MASAPNRRRFRFVGPTTAYALMQACRPGRLGRDRAEERHQRRFDRGSEPERAPPDPSASPDSNGSAGDNAAVAVNTHDGKSVTRSGSRSLKRAATSWIRPTRPSRSRAVRTARPSPSRSRASWSTAIPPCSRPRTSLWRSTPTARTARPSRRRTRTSSRTTPACASPGEGRRQIAAIRKDLEDLRHSGLDTFAVQRRVDYDAGRFLEVLRTQVVPVRNQPGASPGPVTPSGSASPDDSGGVASPSPSDSPSPSPSG